jgi:hypothetical protein
MLFNWLNALPSTGPFPYHERLTKVQKITDLLDLFILELADDPSLDLHVGPSIDVE